MACYGREEAPAIPFLDKKEDEKVRLVCHDLFSSAALLLTVEGESDASFLPKMPDPFPLPSFESYMADSTGAQRRATFFEVARGSDSAYYAKVVSKREDKFHTLEILCSEFPIKIDDLNISAVILSQELIPPASGVFIKAVAVGAIYVERTLILSTKPEKYSSNFKRKGLKLGVIDYKDLPAHYMLEQETPRKPVHEYVEKYAHLNTEDGDKILAYLNIDPKRRYFALPNDVKPEEMGDIIVQQQKEKLSNDHLKTALTLCRNTKTISKAEVEFNRAISIYPKNANAFSSLGSLYRNQKRYKTAIKSFETALNLDETNENYKQLLIKTLKDYLNNNETNDYDEKLIHSMQLFNLQEHVDNKHSVSRFYLEARLALSVGLPWFESFDGDEWNEQQHAVKTKSLERSLSDMELASDNESKDLIITENLILKESGKSVENFLTVDQKPNLIKGKKGFSDIQVQDHNESVKKTEGLADHGCEKGSRSGSDASSFEHITDSSMKHSDCHGDRRKEENKSDNHRDPDQPYDSAGQEITVISSWNRRRRDTHKIHQTLIPPRYDEEMTHLADDRNLSEHHYSEERSSNPNAYHAYAHHYPTEKGVSSKSYKRHHSRERSRHYSRERSHYYSREKSPSPYRSRYPRETSFSPSGRRYSERSLSSHGHHYTKEKLKSPSSTINSYHHSKEKSPDLSTHSLSKEKSPGLSTGTVPREKKSGSSSHSHRHSRKKRQSTRIPGHLRNHDYPSPESGSRYSPDHRAVSPSRRIVEDYFDLDIPYRYSEQEDRWKPEALFPCTSYPSFTKKPAVSIMNEIVDMIEDVRNESK